MIEIRNLTKKFNKGTLTALDDVSCRIESNKIVGFIGPDGSGKTTLLRIVAGILTPNFGDVLINSKKLDVYSKHNLEDLSIDDFQNMISYMPQKFGLYEDLSIIENLNLYAQLHNIKGEIRQKAFDEVLEMTKLKNFKNRLAGNLSGGMKQKLGLACSLLKKPKILILDEPSVGVDPISRRDLIAMVNSMLDKDTTVLWSTAYLDEAEELDHVILLNNGKVSFEGNPKEAINGVRGRVYLFQEITEKRRFFSSELMKKDGVIDSIIRGNSVKFLIKNRDIKDIYTDMKSEFTDIKVPNLITPSFEDACVDILGGLTEKESPVSQYIESLSFSGKENVVEAINLTKKFGDFTAVDNVSFSVKSGKIFGLLGPNGSGKSTTFRILCGLLRQTSGTAKISGIDIANMGSDAKMNIGYMAQKFSLYSILSVRQNLEFFSGAYRIKDKQRKKAVDSMISIFQFEHIQNMNAEILSLGFKQRLALACAIMHKPQVLFLDEPTSGVDPITRKEFWMHINSMVSHGVSVVVTTHFMDEAENCDEIALVYRGKIRAIGSPDELKRLCIGEENPTLEQAFSKIVETANRNDEQFTKVFKE
ncbi:MAG: ATP-binding cassette domain-containing protein [Holosporales bacterium]|jgi:ABC-2 type transport system ATP-binding protein|nr:ATP-binding cassette domain-containing protein [Holosporales bacterium]